MRFPEPHPRPLPAAGGGGETFPAPLPAAGWGFRSARLSIAGAAALAIAASPAPAAAQASVLSDSIVVGAWTFRPTLEVRVRGEYRRHPFDVGGDTYASTAVLAEAYQST